MKSLCSIVLGNWFLFLSNVLSFHFCAFSLIFVLNLLAIYTLPLPSSPLHPTEDRALVFYIYVFIYSGVCVCCSAIEMKLWAPAFTSRYRIRSFAELIIKSFQSQSFLPLSLPPSRSIRLSFLVCVFSVQFSSLFLFQFSWLCSAPVCSLVRRSLFLLLLSELHKRSLSQPTLSLSLSLSINSS